MVVMVTAAAVVVLDITTVIDPKAEMVEMAL